jgi:hypothetical protein
MLLFTTIEALLQYRPASCPRGVLELLLLGAVGFGLALGWSAQSDVRKYDVRNLNRA